MSTDVASKIKISFSHQEQKKYFLENGFFGSLVHILSLIIYTYVSDFYIQFPKAFYFFVPTLTVINLSRMVFLLKPFANNFKNTKSWCLGFKIVIALQGIMLGSMASFIISQNSLNHSNSVLILIMVASIASASTQSFAVAPLLAFNYITSLLLPTIIITPFFHNDRGSYFIISGIIFYMLFNYLFVRFISNNIFKITEQKKELEFQDMQLKGFIDSIPGLVSWFDNDLRYIKMNKNLLEKLNLQDADLINNTLGFANQDTALKTHIEDFKKSQDNTRIIELKSEIDDNEIYYLTVLSKYKYNNKTNISVVSLDITNLKLKEKEIELHRSELHQNEKMINLGEMAGSISHEINNPLAVILGKVQVLKMRVVKNTLTSEFLEASLNTLENTAQRIKKIISSLKSLAQDSYIDSSHVYTVEHIIQSVVDIMSSKLENAGVHLSIQYENRDEKIVCGLVEIGQVLTNLIVNSIHATEEIESKWIRIVTVKKEDKLVIQFIDAGAGISEAIQTKLFTPLFTTKGPGKGTGIGLSISKRIMNKMNGDLYYNNKLEHTCFNIEVPLKKEITFNKNDAA